MKDDYVLYWYNKDVKKWFPMACGTRTDLQERINTYVNQHNWRIEYEPIL